MDKIKIGFVGTGFMGQLAHLCNYAILPDCEVVALAEPRPELAKLVAQQYSIPNIYKNHLELLKECAVDAIVAAQPYSHHITLVPDILNAGRHLLTEKPLALSVESGQKLADLAEEKQLLYMVGYHKRSDPAMEYAKTLIDQWKQTGEYGAMRYIRITMPPGDWIGGAGPAISTNESYPSICIETEVPGFDLATTKLFNSFVNYYIHQVNAMRFLFGEPYHVTFADRSGVLMAVESQSGVCGTIEMAPYNNTLDWQESILVGFEKGTVKIDLPPPLANQIAGTVQVMRDNGQGTPEILQPFMPSVSAMRKQAINFIAALRGEAKVPCDAKEALEDLKIARDYITLFANR